MKNYEKLIQQTNKAVEALQAGAERSHAQNMQRAITQQKTNVGRIQRATERGNLSEPDRTATIEEELAKIRKELGIPL